MSGVDRTGDWDIVIVGAGMAGASIGAELARDARILCIEMEDIAGYHATGRSVAFWTESYGGPGVQPLTSASGPMLAAPDPHFSENGFLSPRGAIHIGRAGDAPLAAAMRDRFAGSGVSLVPLDAPALRTAIPGLRADWSLGLAEPSTTDIDVAALHAAYLRQLARLGGVVRTGVQLRAATRDGGGWRIETSKGRLRCATIVNAAGAWADRVADMCGVAPVGIAPLRRTVVQLRVDPAPTADLPLILDLSGRFYFKPVGGGRLWLSPHDEMPALPGDAAPEQLAVAQAIARLEAVVGWQVAAVERKWAGLRSFAPDRLPVYGPDPLSPGFFWFAGQGGFGIQTAPAAAKLGAALFRGEAAPFGLDPRPYRAARFVA